MKLAGIAAYLALVTGVGGLCVNLVHQVGAEVAGVAARYSISASERPPTLVERRQIEAGADVEPTHPEIARAPTVLEAPGLPASVLAAQLDVAENVDLVPLEPRASRGIRSRSSRGVRPARVAAADVFGRSFGVMLRVSR